MVLKDTMLLFVAYKVRLQFVCTSVYCELNKAPHTYLTKRDRLTACSLEHALTRGVQCLSHAGLPNNDSCNDEDNHTSNKPSQVYPHEYSNIRC